MSRPPLDDENSNTGMIGIGPIPSQAPVAAFNLNQIESLIQTKGFVALHYKHAPNPIRETVNGPVNPNTQAAHRGVMYYSARPLYMIGQQFQIQDRLTAQGIWGVGSALINVSGQYIDNAPEKSVYIRNRDLIVFPSLSHMVSELIEFNPAGKQKLNYKVKGVDYLADSESVYFEGRDFIVQNGEIVWQFGEGKLKPKFKDGKGAVLTCVYFATPIYVVMNLPHALRVLPANSFGHGAFPREATYAPQLLVVKPTTVVEEKEFPELPNAWGDLPLHPDYPDTFSVTGGSI